MLDAGVCPWVVFIPVRKHLRYRLAAIAFMTVGAVCAFVFLSGTRGPKAGASYDEHAPVERNGLSERPTRKSSASTAVGKPITDEEQAGLWNRLVSLSDEEAVALLRSLAERDPVAAFELALELGGLEGRQEAAREALRGLIGRDFEAAIAWGESCKPCPAMECFWAAAADLTTGSDPSRAMDFAARTRGALRLTLLENTFAEWAGEDPETAKHAAMNLGSLEERTAAHIAILNSVSDEDFNGTLAWIESIKEPELQDAVYYHAAREWSSRDPDGAAGFTEALVESDYKTHLAGMVLESWIKQDPESAMAWTSRLKDQESREEAVSRGIRQTFEASPERAASLSLNLPGESERAAAIEYVISAWVERDPDGLAEWIGKVPDTETRANMSRMMEDHLQPDTK